jgi:hypothetical protein
MFLSRPKRVGDLRVAPSSRAVQPFRDAGDGNPPICTSDALSNLKRTAAAMHQDKEKSRQSEQMWRDKLTVADQLAKELEAKLSAGLRASAGLRSTIAESKTS